MPRNPPRRLVPKTKRLDEITTPGSGGMRFNPKAKLDPSQVEDLRRSPERKLFDEMKNRWPFLTMEQRMQWMADYTRTTGKKPPKGMASSVPTWMRQLPPNKKKRKFPSSRGS